MKGIDRLLFFTVGGACLMLLLFTRLASGASQTVQAAGESAVPRVEPVFLDSQWQAQPDVRPDGDQRVFQVNEDGKPTPKPDPTPKKKKKSQPIAEVANSSKDCSLGLSYPESVRQWCDLIERYAAESGLDAQLVAAVILQESGGDPRAYSHSGAVGLMQVMPRDGLAASFMCANGPCFATRPSMAELFEPEFNIAYGTQMLAGLVQKQGSLREALRAYGPHDVGYRYADLVLRIYQSYQ